MSRSLFADWEPICLFESDFPDFVPLFPINAFEPTSRCPHHGRIRRGSRLVCMCCHQSGLDHLPLPGRIDVAASSRTEAEIKADALAQMRGKAR